MLNVQAVVTSHLLVTFYVTQITICQGQDFIVLKLPNACIALEPLRLDDY